MGKNNDNEYLNGVIAIINWLVGVIVVVAWISLSFRKSPPQVYDIGKATYTKINYVLSDKKD